MIIALIQNEKHLNYYVFFVFVFITGLMLINNQYECLNTLNATPCFIDIDFFIPFTEPFDSSRR